MTIELTEEQQKVLTASKNELRKAIHSPTHTEYILVDAAEYASIASVLEEERQLKGILKISSQNAARRMLEEQ